MPHDVGSGAANLRLHMRRGSAVGSSFEVGIGESTLGRRPECAVRLDGFKDFLVSGRHARIVRTNLGCRLEDQNSTNGTWLNGNRVAGAVDLHDGDRITLGDPTQEGSVELLLEWPGGPTRSTEPADDAEATRAAEAGAGATVAFRCSNCDFAGSAPQASVGRQFACPSCGATSILRPAVRLSMGSGRSPAASPGLPPTKASPKLPPTAVAPAPPVTQMPPVSAMPPASAMPLEAEPAEPTAPGGEPGVLGRFLGKVNRAVSRFTERPKLKKRIAELRARDAELQAQAVEVFGELGAALRSAGIGSTGFARSAELEAATAAAAACASAEAELDRQRQDARNEAETAVAAWRSRRDEAARRVDESRVRHESAATRLAVAREALRAAAVAPLERLAALGRELAMSAREDAEHLPDDLAARHASRLADATARLSQLGFPAGIEERFAARAEAEAEEEAAEAQRRAAVAELTEIDAQQTAIESAASGREEALRVEGEKLLRERLPVEHELRVLHAELGDRALSRAGVCPEELPQTARARALRDERAALADEIAQLEVELNNL